MHHPAAAAPHGAQVDDRLTPITVIWMVERSGVGLCIVSTRHYCDYIRIVVVEFEMIMSQKLRRCPPRNSGIDNLIIFKPIRQIFRQDISDLFRIGICILGYRPTVGIRST